MTSVDILNRIVAEEGNCCWSTPKTCAQCPMSKLRQHPDGRWMSCVEAIGIHADYTEEEADSLYKEAAIKLLIEHEIDGMLKENTTDVVE
jgi:hypothetical protein